MKIGSDVPLRTKPRKLRIKKPRLSTKTKNRLDALKKLGDEAANRNPVVNTIKSGYRTTSALDQLIRGRKRRLTPLDRLMRL